MKDNRLYLIVIIECIERIQEYTSEGKEQFLTDTKTQDAAIRNLQILAEATKRIPDEVKEKHPEIDWHGIVGLRNLLVHEYLNINIIRVWEIIEGKLPNLKNRIEIILRELGSINGTG